MKQRLKKINILAILVITVLFFSPAQAIAGNEEEQFSSLLFINQIYELVLANYYSPPEGVDLLNPALKILSEKISEKNIDFLSEDLNNEKALDEFNSIFFEVTKDYSGDFEDLSAEISDVIIDSLENKYSCLLREKDYGNLEELMNNGRGVGTGIVLSCKENIYSIASVIPGTSAESAGLMRGDVILEVNGKEVENLPSEEVYSLFFGDSGDFISITVVRNESLLTFELFIEEFFIEDYVITDLGNNMLYLKINYFSPSTAEGIIQDLNSLQLENYKGLIMDLRDNPGGILESAINLGKLFLSSGPLLITETNRGKKTVYSDNPQSLNIPLAVIINNGTMSSAEVLSKILQNGKRCQVIGMNSYGKGSIQGIFPLENGMALRLTTARVFDLSGIALDEGVFPDTKVSSGEDPLLKAIETFKSEIP